MKTKTESLKEIGRIMDEYANVDKSNNQSKENKKLIKLNKELRMNKRELSLCIGELCMKLGMTKRDAEKYSEHALSSYVSRGWRKSNRLHSQQVIDG